MKNNKITSGYPESIITAPPAPTNLPTPMGHCGFYCGCCPSYTAGQCSGCQEAHQRGDCFTRDCAAKRGLSFCPQCADFPCGELLRRSKATVLDREWLLWKRRQRG